MGNCLAPCKPCSGSYTKKHGKVVRVAKPDGKVLEFSSPIHVKDILTNFPDFGVGVSKEATEIFSPDHELKGGRLYHLIPSLCSTTNVTTLGTTEQGSGIKRIKVVITRQQLEKLVTKQISIEDILSEVKTVGAGFPNNQKPKLDTILEENEW